MNHPYRTPPPKPVTLTATDLLVAIDAIAGSLRIHGSGFFRFDEKVRGRLQTTLMEILSNTQYTVEVVSEPEEEEETDQKR